MVHVLLIRSPLCNYLQVGLSLLIIYGLELLAYNDLYLKICSTNYYDNNLIMGKHFRPYIYKSYIHKSKSGETIYKTKRLFTNMSCSMITYTPCNSI